jgi:hypothetical protein
MERQALGELQRLAATQHGLFTSSQARGLGFSKSWLQQATEWGWLRGVRRGVYRFAGHAPSKWESILAAALACGRTAIISHGAAAAIHAFWGSAEAQPELTVTGHGGRRLAGVRIHHTIRLLAEDVVWRSGVQVTSPIRTLIDLAPVTNDYRLPRVIDEGAVARLWTPEEVAVRLDQFGGGRLGTPRLRRLLEQRMGEGTADNVLEQRVVRVIKRWLPPFQVHHRIDLAGRIVELDVAWPELLIGAEIDGRHVRLASRTKFDSDRVRSNLLETSGWRVVHLTSTMDDLTLVAQLVPLFPAHLIDRRLRSELSARASETSPR